jgi:hypothetical protein
VNSGLIEELRQFGRTGPPRALPQSLAKKIVSRLLVSGLALLFPVTFLVALQLSNPAIANQIRLNWKKTEVVEGRVTSSQLRKKTKKRSLYMLHFTYQSKSGEDLEGDCFEFDPSVQPGDPCRVEYLTADHHVARTVGGFLHPSEVRPEARWIWIAVLAGLLVHMVVKHLRQVRLLRNGLSVVGHVDQTSVDKEGRTTIQYSFDVDGARVLGKVVLSKKRMDEAKALTGSLVDCTILYRDSDPSSSIMIEALGL